MITSFSQSANRYNPYRSIKDLTPSVEIAFCTLTKEDL